MRGSQRTAGVVTLCTLLAGLSATVLAQDGLRSASLPERTALPPLPSRTPDVFAVAPDFWRRPQPPVLVVPGAPLVVWPGLGVAAGHRGTQRRAVVADHELPGQAAQQPPSSPLSPASADVRAPQVVLPYVKTTFYVIPGCYAGDTMPATERLPAGCRIEDVRAVER